MRSLFAFFSKEMTDHIRSGKFLLLLIVFVFIGIMNPATAKLTPWLLDIMSDTLAQSGMIITEVTVSALDSWVQFFKNIPLGIIAFILIESSIFTKEYEKGTFVPVLTKGLERYKVVIAKALLLDISWSVFYWLCFGITYAYSAYFWDNSIAVNLFFSGVCYWLFGFLTVQLLILFSTVMKSNIGVLAAVGCTFLVMYLLSFLPDVKEYIPIYISDGYSLIYGLKETGEYIRAIAAAAVMCVLSFVTSIPVFNRTDISRN